MRILHTVLVVILGCGYAVGQDADDVTLNLHPVLHKSAKGRTSLDIGIEIHNKTDRPKVFILPQDGSYWGWLDPKYVLTVRNERGEALSLPPRCGNFGGRYDESTMISVGPRKTLYVMAHRIPYAITGQKKLDISLTYSVTNPRQNESGHGKAKENWPDNVFVGSIRSPAITVDLLKKLPPTDHIDLGHAHLKGLHEPGMTENGFSLVLYPPKLKTQERADRFARLQVSNKSDETISFKNWSIEYNWYDERNNAVEDYHYAGDNLWYRGEFPPELRPARVANSALPIGFQKKAGIYRASVDLLVDGKRMATSNMIEVEVQPNPLLERKKESAEPEDAGDKK